MDKLLRRTRMAERQVARRAKKMERLKWTSDTKWDRISRKQALRREVGEQMRLAIKARHEDWELGPLAPRRDVSLLDKNDVYWGSVSASRFRQDYELTKAEKEARCKWAGGLQNICIAQGDRVVVLEGAYKNQIGEIEDINLQSACVSLKSHFVTNVTMPAFLVDDEVKPVMPFNSPIPISAVRLVHPIRDPATNTAKDVIIRELRPINITHDRISRRSAWQRMVPGLNVKIPWPQQAPVKKEDHEGDTLRIEVEEKTFVPTLLRPPMPETVVDELRNQYSKFRTRHTEEYIAQKEAEEAEKKARLASGKTMLTPLQELNRLERERRRALGQPVLTDEMLEKVGRIIAENKTRIPTKTWAALSVAAEESAAAADAASLESAVEQLSLDQDGEPGSRSSPS
ncbi:hypothetical protein GQ53DRAFT_261441 [Thozetella sp. PMI_491]|nr:hypothetical protein GQ53DRAFT_261441 [Thozetella sp. PMI_491]